MTIAIDTNTSARFMQVRDLTALRQQRPTSRRDRDLALVDDQNALYKFDANSAATADGITIVAPSSGGGKWLRLSALEAVEASTVLNPVALTPTKGQAWLINGAGAGGWAGKDKKLAVYVAGVVTAAASWLFVTPIAGMKVASKATGLLFCSDGTNWIGPDSLGSGAVSNDELATDVKVGSLAALTTTVKTSVQGAINELDAALGVVEGHFGQAALTDAGAATADALTDNSGGSAADQTLAVLTGTDGSAGAGDAAPLVATADAIAKLTEETNALIVDVAAIRTKFNDLLDRLRTTGGSAILLD